MCWAGRSEGARLGATLPGQLEAAPRHQGWLLCPAGLEPAPIGSLRLCGHPLSKGHAHPGTAQLLGAPPVLSAASMHAPPPAAALLLPATF